MFDVSDADRTVANQHANYIKPILESRHAMPIYPDHGGMRKMPALSITYRANWTTKVRPTTCLHLYEGNCVAPLNNQIDVSMPDTKPPRNDSPPAPKHPLFG